VEGQRRGGISQSLRRHIDEAAESVLEYLKIGRESFMITGCWANVSAPGAAHRVQNHPNNYLSGVYYVRMQQGANTINFLDPRPQTAIIRPPITELTAENTEQVVVSVKDGMLLMFPAWLQHSVDPNRSGFPIFLGEDACYMRVPWQKKWSAAARPP
jgi:uncharacterized protein (TIGR02466 family)